MERIGEELHKIFANVNSWLHFAEAKNGMLIAIAGAATLAIFPELNSLEIHRITYIYLVSLEIFLILSMLISLMSFVPQTKIKWLWCPDEPDDDDNIFFFGHIQKYDPNSYLEKLTKAMGTPTLGSSSKLHTDLAYQIVTNSFITTRKYNYFRIATWVLISGVITPPIGLVLFFIFDPNQ